MIGDVAQSRWTLRFRDRALERAYRDDLALQLRTQVTWVLVVMVVAWFSAAVFDEEIAGSPANADFMLILRLAIGGPPLVIATALYAWLPERAFLRWNQAVVLVGTLSLTVTWAIAAMWLPDPERAPLGAAVQA